MSQIRLSKNKIKQADAWLDKAMQLHRKRRLKQAEVIYRQILDLIPNHADASHLLALILSKRDPGMALRLMNVALDCHPTFAIYYLNRGLIFKRLEDFNRARRDFQRAILVNAKMTKAHCQLGHVLLELDEHEAAISAYQKALKLAPNNYLLHNCLGDAYLANRDFQKAMECYEGALEIKPGDASTYSSLGMVFNHMNQLEQAEAYLQKALALEPNNTKIHSDLGRNYKDQRKMEEALSCLEKSLLLHPSSKTLQFNKAFCLLQMGRYLEGWEKYEYRFEVKKRRRQYGIFSKPVWRGEDLSGKTLFVHAEQGFGDTLQFVRYLPLVKARGGRVVFECQRELMCIVEPLKEQLGIDHIFPPKQEEKPDYDYHIALMSLAHICKTTLETIPFPEGYIRSCKENAERLDDIDPVGIGYLRVGIVWAGNKKYKGDLKRSVPFGYVKPFLAQSSGVRFYSLQYGERAEDFEAHGLGERVFDLSQHIRNFADTVAFVEQLDLVITSDTAMAHLCGAMGQRTWVMLSFSPEFRWLTGRQDSPWYKSIRLFCQISPGDWDSVMASLSHALLLERKDL